MDTISEPEFERLCAEIYSDRAEIYQLLPSVSGRDALLWMLLGSLVVLLSVPEEEQPFVDSAASPDPYGEAIVMLLQERAAPVFDPHTHLAELSAKLEAEP